MTELRLPLIVTPPGVKGALEGLGGEVDRLAGRCRELEAFLDWLIAMDDPEDVVGREERRTVTLTKIIDRARALGGRGS